MAVVAAIAVEAPISAPMMASGAAGPRGGGRAPIMEDLSIRTLVSRNSKGIDVQTDKAEAASTASTDGPCRHSAGTH